MPVPPDCLVRAPGLAARICRLVRTPPLIRGRAWACAGFRGSGLGFELAAVHCGAHYGPHRLEFALGYYSAHVRTEPRWHGSFRGPRAGRPARPSKEGRRPSDASRRSRLKSMAVLSCPIQLAVAAAPARGVRRPAAPFHLAPRGRVSGAAAEAEAISLLHATTT